MNLLSLILMISILGSVFKEGENQLINGFGALQRDFNYHASILGNSSYTCSGGIIDTTHVITAAHCVADYTPIELLILAGIADLRDWQRVFRFVEQIYIPADFYSNRRSNDIGVLKLERPFVFGENLGAVQLPFAPLSNDDTECTFASLDSSLMQIDEWILSWIVLKRIHNTVCECMLQFRLPSHVFCAIDAIETAKPMPGDSGGVLVCEGVAVGIFSARRENENFSPNVFCSIYDHLDLIETAIKL